MAAHRLLLELGRGGMGTVYLAVTEGAGGFTKLKVVKQLRDDMAENAQLLQMFLEEARLSARLNHPNIVQTNEVGFDGRHHFIEMEYLEGQSLDALARRLEKGRRRLDLVDGVWVLSQVLAALHYAHTLADVTGRPLRIVHRDVSPHNVFVTFEGVVKLLDFGIAKAVDSQLDTATGIIKGKVTYMAPEQAHRRPLDGRSDVFSVGVMLWQLATGERLWQDLSDFEIYMRLESGDIPSAKSVNRDVDPALDGVCKKALARDPAERYANAADMMAALEMWLDITSVRTGPKRLAKILTETFAERREAIRKEVEEQLHRAARAPQGSQTEIPLLAEAQAYQATATDSLVDGQSKGPIAHPPVMGAPDTPRVGVRVEPADQKEIDRTRTSGAVVSDWAAPRRPRARWALGGLVMAVAATGIGLWSVRRPSTPSASAASSTDGGTVPARECSENRECVRPGGKPALCRKADGVCVTLQTDRCHVLAEPSDPANAETIWLGAMFHTPGDDPDALGLVNERGLDVARQDFVKMSHGLPAFRLDGPARPLAIVSCDATTDAPKIARFLVEEARVPAVFGFGTSEELITLAASEFIPRGVLAMGVLNGSPLIPRIPQPNGTSRLVWTTSLNASVDEAFVAKVVPEVFEGKLRREGAVLKDERLRVAFLRDDSLNSTTSAEVLLRKLRFNDKSALANGHDFDEIVVHGHLRDLDENARIVEELLGFEPHVVVFYWASGSEDYISTFFAPLERRWSVRRFRPVYLADDVLVWPSLPSLINERPDLQNRIYGMYGPATTPTSLHFAMRYNESARVKMAPSLAPSPAYDAFYTLAYAAFALGNAPITGPRLASAIARLLPPGPNVDVGSGDMFTAFELLRSGKNIDLNGASTKLDFDTETGGTRGDLVLDCMARDARTHVVEPAETELVYDSVSDTIHGTLACHGPQR